MSDAKIKTVEHKKQKYLAQNGGSGDNLTAAQNRQLRKTKTRLDHEQQRSVHLETKRNRRQRFRDWMAGFR